MSLPTGDFTGIVETAQLEAALKTLAGGRVYDTNADDAEILARDKDGAIRPYLVFRTSPPSATSTGRGVALGEQDQPHTLTGTVTACAADSGEARDLMAAAMRVVIGTQVTANSLPIAARGGNSWTTTDNDSRPSRYNFVFYWRTTINI